MLSINKKYLLFLAGFFLLSCVGLKRPPKLEKKEIEYLDRKAERIYNNGQIAFNKGKYEDGLRNFREVARNLSFTEKGDDSQFMVALCYYRLKNYSSAIDESERLKKNFPSSPFIDDVNLILYETHLRFSNRVEASYALIEILDKSDDESFRDKAEKKLTKLVGDLSLEELYKIKKKCKIKSLAPLILYRIGRYEFEIQNYRKAKEIFETLIEKYPDSTYALKAEGLYEKAKKGRGLVSNRIGLIAPLSGEYYFYGNAVKNGLKLALSEYNKDSKEKLELIYYDSKGDAIEAVKGMKLLIKNEDVLVIVGPIFTASVIPAAVIADYSNIPLISPTATESRIQDLGEYVFQLNTGLRYEAREVARYAIEEEGYRTFAVIHPKDSYGSSLANSFVNEVNRLGGNVLTTQSYECGTTDFGEILAIVKEVAPEAIYIPGYADDVILISTQIRYYEVESALLGGDRWMEEKVANLAEDYVEGAVFACFFGEENTNNAEEEFVKTYKEKFGIEPMRASVLSYDAGKVIVESVKEGACTPFEIKEFLDSMPMRRGISGVVYLSKNIKPANLRLYRIKKGEVVPVHIW